MIKKLYNLWKRFIEVSMRMLAVGWLILSNLFPIILIVLTLAVTMLDFITKALLFIGQHAEISFDLVWDATEALQSMADAGWPPQFANAVAWVNQIVPLGEMVVMFSSLCALFMTGIIFRIAKSFLKAS